MVLPVSSSRVISSSTTSRESAPRSSTILLSNVIYDCGIPSCSARSFAILSNIIDNLLKIYIKIILPNSVRVKKFLLCLLRLVQLFDR